MIIVCVSPVDLQELYPIYHALKRLEYPIINVGLKPYRNGLSYITDGYEVYEITVSDYVRLHKRRVPGTYVLHYKGAGLLPIDRFMKHIDYYEKRYDAQVEEPFWAYWQRWLESRGDT